MQIDSSRILVLWDLDGTLILEPSWTLVHLLLGTQESHGVPLEQQYLEGQIKYEEFANQVTNQWRGVSTELIQETIPSITFREGSHEISDFLKWLRRFLIVYFKY